jgi:serine/threonine protein kinase
MTSHKPFDTIGQYTITHHEIGKGSTAVVKEGYLTSDKSPVAIKIITKSKLSVKQSTSIETEISSLKNLSHPNLIQMFQVYRDKEKIYIITELCEKRDLRRWIQENPFNEKQIRKFLMEIVKGINFLHKRNYMHRDIKSGNILLTNDLRVKIADFGFTRYVDTDDLATTICGTPAFLAPEVLNNDSYDSKVDIWSLGIIFYEMIYKKVPLKVVRDKTSDDEMIRVIYEKIVYPETVMSDLGIDLLQHMLEMDPVKRYNIQQIIEHPYLDMKGDSDVLSETAILTEQFEVITVQDIDENEFKQSIDHQGNEGILGSCVIA